MKKTNTKIAAPVEGYHAPKVRVITVKVEGIICESWGEAGAAGAPLSINEEEEDY